MGLAVAVEDLRQPNQLPAFDSIWQSIQGPARMLSALAKGHLTLEST